MQGSRNNFSEPNKKTKYGQHGGEFWIGTVVAYAAQKDQIESGFGWMYKVRIDGDHNKGKPGDATVTKDEDLSYAYCLLPTTAGSGAGYKLRSVRISQGDTVFGLRGGGVGAPSFIIGVLPRTRFTELEESGNFATLSGFYESLKNNGILSGEFNDQIGPGTPGATALDPKEWTKATAKNPSEKVKEIVPSVEKNDKGEFKEISEEDTEKNSLENKVSKVNEKWKPGDNLNTATMEYLKESFEKGELSPKDWESALKQASEQGLEGYEEYVIKEEIKKEVEPKILDSKQKLEAALTKGNFDAYERSVLNVDNTTIRDDGRVVPPFNLARTLNYRRELIKKRDTLISSIEFDKRNMGQILNGVVIITQEYINDSERRLVEINNEISSIEDRGTIFSD